jgi:acyl-CoA synthetase (NDP forming)
MLGSAVGTTYEEALPLLLDDPGIDAVIVLFVPPVVAGADEVAEAVARASGRAGDKPSSSRSSAGAARRTLCSRAGCVFRLSRVGCTSARRAAARANGCAAHRARAGARGIRREARCAIAREAGDRWLTAAETRALLESYAIPVVAERDCRDARRGVAAAAELGYPVV